MHAYAIPINSWKDEIQFHTWMHLKASWLHDSNIEWIHNCNYTGLSGSM